MNKYKALMKQIVKTGIIAGVVVAVALALYIGLSVFSDSVVDTKTQEESALNQQTSLRDSLRQQLAQSNDAEKEYLTLIENRTTEKFSAAAAPTGLKEYVADLWQRFRFSAANQLKLSKSIASNEVASDKPISSSYDVMLQRNLLLEFKAASDLHAFSIIDDMRRSMPGLVRIDSISVSRLGDITPSVLEQMEGGTSLLMVDVKIEFTWIRIQPKVEIGPDGKPIVKGTP